MHPVQTSTEIKTLICRYGGSVSANSHVPASLLDESEHETEWKIDKLLSLPRPPLPPIETAFSPCGNVSVIRTGVVPPFASASPRLVAVNTI